MSSEVAPTKSTTDLREAFEPAKLQLERMPILRGVFECLSSNLAELVRSYSIPPATIELKGLSTGTTRSLFEEYDDGLCAIFGVAPWDASVIIGFDRRFLFTLCDTVYGGDGGNPHVASNRPPSKIEVVTARELLLLASKALESLLSAIEPLTLTLARIETTVDFKTVGVPDTQAVMAQITAQLQEGGGKVFVIIPQSPLMPLRRKLENDRPQTSALSDPEWSRSLMNEVARADVQLTAVMEGPEMTLQQIAAIRIGDLLRLPATVDSLLRLENSGECMFKCTLGQSQGRFTVQIARGVSMESAWPDDIVAKDLTSIISRQHALDRLR